MASVYTHTASFWNREAFTHRCFYTQQAFTQRSFYTQQAFTHTSVYTQNTYTQCCYTWQASTQTETFTERRIYTQGSFYTQQAFEHKIFYTQQAFTGNNVFTQRSFLVHNHNRNCSLQNRISTPKRQKDDFEALFIRIFQRKITSAKIVKICWLCHCRSLDAATPILFTRSSCKRQ